MKNREPIDMNVSLASIEASKVIVFCHDEGSMRVVAPLEDDRRR